VPEVALASAFRRDQHCADALFLKRSRQLGALALKQAVAREPDDRFRLMPPTSSRGLN